MLRNVMVCALLLGIAGCGCGGGGTVVLMPPEAIEAVVDFKVLLPVIPIAPPQAIKVDIAFVLDDSDTMNNGALSGLAGAGGFDARERSQAAQAIMRRLETTVQARLAAQYPGQAAVIDLAFAVARYEDFGGEFTSSLRRVGPVDDTSNRDNDMDARPFILNMPMLRQAHPEFDARFASALEREAPGDGSPFVQLPTIFDPVRVIDPQSAIEALYQIAAPANFDGTFGGFDGNRDGDTKDSGQPTGRNVGRNPQTRPGSSGDVPAIGFQAAGSDADAEPLYQVTDEDGAVVMVPAIDGGGMVPSVASGNIGGVGWRAGAARFVVLATDIATVAPVAADPPPSAITSSNGAPDAPRQATSVLTAAFDGGVRALSPLTKVTESRFGLAGPGSTVAPAGAHTVRETVARLNALDIEVVLLGVQSGGVFGGVGPSEETPVSQFFPTVGGEHSPLVGDPFPVYPEFDPWFWLNGISLLTTPRIGVAFESDDANGFRGVYDMRAVWPFDDDDLEGTDESGIQDTATDALVERIRAWVDPTSETGDANSPYVAGHGPLVPLGLRPALPQAAYRLELTVDALLATADVRQTQPAGTLVSNPSAPFPVRWSDQSAIAEPVALRDGTNLAPLTYTLRDQSVTLPATHELGYEIRARFTGNFSYAPGAMRDAATEAAIRAAIAAGVPADGALGMVSIPAAPNPTVTTFPIVRGARFEVWVRDDDAPGFGVRLLGVTDGCAFVSDQTTGQDNRDQPHCSTTP